MPVIFWGVISLLYLTLAILQFKWSRDTFPLPEFKGKLAEIMGIPTGMSEFADDMNKFIDHFNNHNRKINRTQTLGYSLAFLAALFSTIITVTSII